MKKLFAFFFVLVITTTLWAHDFEVDGIYYNHINEKEVEVTYQGSHNTEYYEYFGSINIPSFVTYNGNEYSVSHIGHGAFYNCRITSITIPNSVKSIGNDAFRFCKDSLTNVIIGDGVMSIGSCAFQECASLTRVVMGNNVASIGECAFNRCSSLSSITIPNSVKSIEAWTFAECSSLKSVHIGNSVTNIGHCAFKECSSLVSVCLPNSVTNIGDFAFSNCVSLARVSIGPCVASIGFWGFENCSSLTSITIPNSVKYIEYEAFKNCSALTSITCQATIPPTLGDNVFCSVANSIPLYVPCESLETYKVHISWGQFTNIQCVPEDESAVENTHSPSPMTDCQKLIRNGQLLIIRNCKIYNAQGVVII